MTPLAAQEVGVSLKLPRFALAAQEASRTREVGVSLKLPQKLPRFALAAQEAAKARRDD